MFSVLRRSVVYEWRDGEAYLRIRLPVYGEILLPSFLESLLHDRSLRRLQYVRQLSAVYLHLPGAQGSRLEHCLGVAYLAHVFLSRSDVMNTIRGALLSILKKHGVQVSDQEAARLVECIIKVLVILSLIHDVFHPLWSHAVEDYVFESIKKVLDPPLRDKFRRKHVDKVLLFIALADHPAAEYIRREVKYLREFNLLIKRYLSQSLKFDREELALFNLAVAALLLDDPKDPRDMEIVDCIVRNFGQNDSRMLLQEIFSLILYPLVKLLLDDIILDFDRLDYVNRDSLHVYGINQRIPWKEIINNIRLDISTDNKIIATIDSHIKPLIYEFFYARLDNYVRIYKSVRTIAYEEALLHIVYAVMSVKRWFSGTGGDGEGEPSYTKLLDLFFSTDEALRLEVYTVVKKLKKERGN